MVTKVLNISIAQSLFAIEEDAYARLDEYLESVKGYFKNTEGRDEIISDIESRIAEQLRDTKEQVVSLATVESVLKEMGTTADFEEVRESTRAAQPAAEKASSISDKRLYRNPDDKMIAGVCSGLAAYFGVEVVWMRLGFAFITLLNGLGLAIYFILWLVIPEAKTRAQKLEMAGSPVNLETISETVRERVSEVQVDRTGIARVLSLPFVFIGKLISGIFRVLGPVVRIVVGAALTIGPMFAIAAVFVASGFLYTKEVWISNDVTLQTLLGQPLHFLAILGITISIIIPAAFLLMTGLSLFQRKSVVNGTMALGMLGAWFVSLVLSGFAAATAATNYHEFVRASPAHAETSEEIVLSGTFSSVAVARGMSVEFAQGTSTSLVAMGRVKDMGHVDAHIENGVLTIAPLPVEKKMWCIVCGTRRPRLVLRVPALAEVSVAEGAAIFSDAFPARESLSLDLDQGAYANLELNLKSLKADVTSGSHLELKGVAAKAQITLNHGSSIEAEDLRVSEMTISASNGSRARISATDLLDITVSRASRVVYGGDPVVTVTADVSSSVVALHEEE